MEPKSILELSTSASETQSTQKNQRKRKISYVSTELSLSGNSPSKKMPKAAERKYDKIIMPSSKSIDLSDGTRNLLDASFFSGIKTERFAVDEESFRVSTELSLSLTSNSLKTNNLKVNRKNISCRHPWDGVDENGVSTKLCLFDETWITKRVEDPWKIKKELTSTDLGKSSRLLLPSSEVKKHLFPMLRAIEDNGIDVTVFDCDTETKYNLVFEKWKSSRAYVLKGGWNPYFVQRRGLKENDTVGLYWDVPTSTFRFSLLQRA